MSANHQIYLFLVKENGIEVLKETNGIGGQPTQDILTEVEPDDTIEWLFDSTSGIASINSIVPTVDDLFSNLTTGEQNGVSGRISPNAPPSPITPYLYAIYYTPSGTGSIKRGDPKIKVNSGTSES